MIKTTPILATIAILAGCQSRHISQSEYWHSRASQIKIGDTRREVEELLPPCSGTEATTTGSGRVESYWVDENWQVCIKYDGTGGTDWLSQESPENKVIEPPILNEGKMPAPITIDNIKTSNQRVDLTR